MKISKQGLDLIKHFESLHDGDLSVIDLQPKMCPAGIWTVGYGRALKNKEGEYLKGDEDKTEAYAMYPNLTEEQACIMLDQDCDQRESMVNSLNIEFKQHEFDAMVSFVYNVGFHNLINSTLLKYIQSGYSGESITWAFGLWNKAKENGILKVLPGLTRRRKSESHLYLTGELKF